MNQPFWNYSVSYRFGQVDERVEEKQAGFSQVWKEVRKHTATVKAGLPGWDWSQTAELGCVGAECWAVIDWVLEQHLGAGNGGLVLGLALARPHIL